MADCKKCSKPITDRQTLKCKECNNDYHLSCTSVSEARFYSTLTGNHRADWKCFTCVTLANNIEKMKKIRDESPDNITRRTKHLINISTDNSFQSLNIDSDDDDDDFEDTLPTNTTESYQRTDQFSEIEQLKTKIKDLEIQLLESKQKNDILLEENQALKNSSVKKKKDLKQKKVQSSSEFPCIPNSPKTQQQNSTSAIITIESSNLNSKEDIQKSKTEIHKEKHYETQNIDNNPKRRKICLISSNTKNNVLQSTESRLPQVQICHYLTPGGGVTQLLDGIENKLKDFTYEDHCVIFIGEHDFLEAVRYDMLIRYIRSKLMGIKNTNIIICLPTFKYCKHVNLFNKRIEIFNNLLYLDNNTFEYVYLIDSNKDLKYTSEMFNIITGHINKRGFRTILNNIERQISDIGDYYSEYIVNPDDEPPNLEFFRK